MRRPPGLRELRKRACVHVPTMPSCLLVPAPPCANDRFRPTAYQPCRRVPPPTAAVKRSHARRPSRRLMALLSEERDQAPDQVIQYGLAEREFHRALAGQVRPELLRESGVGSGQRVHRDVALPRREVHQVLAPECHRWDLVADPLPDGAPDMPQDDLNVVWLRADVLLDGRECSATAGGLVPPAVREWRRRTVRADGVGCGRQRRGGNRPGGRTRWPAHGPATNSPARACRASPPAASAMPRPEQNWQFCTGHRTLNLLAAIAPSRR
jgi:hypothetical protein